MLHLHYREQVNCVTVSVEFISELHVEQVNLQRFVLFSPRSSKLWSCCPCWGLRCPRGPIYLLPFLSPSFRFPAKTGVKFYRCNLVERGDIPVRGFFHCLLCITGILVWCLCYQICLHHFSVGFQGPALWQRVTLDCGHHFNYRIRTAARGKIITVQIVLFLYDKICKCSVES